MATAVVKERTMVAWISGHLEKWTVLRHLGGRIGFCDCLNVKGDSEGEGGIKDDSQISYSRNGQDGEIIS